MGRSTLGFGRIIATAGSSRPTVTPDVSATRSLRPPLGVWTLLGGVDEPEPAPVPWTTRALPTSSAPSVRRAPTTAQPAPAKPPKPVDSKVDALRRLLESRGMIEPSTTEPSAPTSASPVAPAAGAAPATPESATPGDRTATTAGSATAPGQFGQRVRPEPTRPDSPLSSLFPDTGSTPTARRQRRSKGVDLDRFRRSLESRGMMPAEEGSAPSRGDGTVRRSAPPEAPTSRPNERSTPARPEATSDPESDTDGVPAVAPPRNIPLTLTPMGTGAFRRHAPGDERAATAKPIRPRSSPSPVVSRAADGRRATVAVRRRIAGRRFVTPQADGIEAPDVRSFDTSTPISAAALAAALTAETPPSTTGVAAPAPARYDTPAHRSAVAPGPGALARALESGLASATSATAPAASVRTNDPVRRSETPAADRSPVSRAAVAPPPVQRSADHPAPRPTSSPGTPAVSSPATSRTANDPVAAPPSTERPATPDPTVIAPDTAELLDSTSPDHTVVSRSTDDRTAPTPAPATHRPATAPPATPDPAIARSADGRGAPTPPSPSAPASTPASTQRPTPTPGTDRSAAARPTAPDPAVVAAATAELLESTSPDRTIISRSPDDERPPVDLGERFLRELGRSPDVAARELPRPFQPLATAIAGSARQVKLSTDATTRRALDSVGKQAVTVGDTIHLSRPARDDVQTHEVLAHELVHVANPSPVPRFFDDDHRGPEERMAEQVAQVIRRSPIVPASPVPSGSQSAPTAPTSTTAGAVTGGSVGGIRRATAPTSPSGSASPSTSTPSPPDADRIRRTAGISVRRDALADPSADGDEVSGDASIIGTGTALERDWFDNLVERTVDRVVQRIEQRVMIELERRGGRHWRNF
ncbi:MAG: DUF4157 domain-containing protein [Ilumatobacter fluminis]